MEIYTAPTNKVTALKLSNPTYWSLLLTRSQYSETEIDQALTAIDEANAKLHGFLSSAYDLLVFENGLEMNYIPNGFASEGHQKLSDMLSMISYISPSMSQNDHLNCFPVRKWEKEIARLYNQIAKIEKFINTIK